MMIFFCTSIINYIVQICGAVLMLVFLWLACYTEIKVLKDYLRAQTFKHTTRMSCMLMARYMYIMYFASLARFHVTKSAARGELVVGIGEWGGKQVTQNLPMVVGSTNYFSIRCATSKVAYYTLLLVVWQHK